MADLEVEHTYSPPADAVTPDLGGLPGVARTRDAGTVELVARYFDTPDSALLRAGVTLRRRTGGEDEGWHLKLPSDEGRWEVRLPLARARSVPPKPLRDAVMGWTRGTDLVPVATITTRRTVVDLVGDGGAVLAQLADDEVEGVPHLADPSEPVVWREWELELVEGEPELLAAADELLARTGVEPSDTGVKLARVIGPPVPPRPELPTPKKRRSARLLVHARLAEQVAELGRRDSEVRRGEPEGVHKARVACRRLRSALATFRPVLEREVTEPIRVELRWLAHALGDARDLDVAHARLRDLVDELDPDLVMGPVRRRIDRAYAPRRREAHARARDALASERYFALRGELDRLAAAPPWTERADADARDVLPRRLRKDWKRLRKRFLAAEGATAPAERDEAVHATRRAAKRLRYAAETLTPVWGRDAKAVTKAAKGMASTLGVRQDALVTMPQLVSLARDAAGDGENAFTYGLLHAEERRLAGEVDDGFADLVDDVEQAVQRASL